MIQLEAGKWLFIDLIGLPLIFLLAFFLLLDRILDFWRWVLEVLQAPLGIPGVVATRIVEIWPLHVAIPFYTVEAQWPAALDLRTGWIFTAVLAIGGFVLRGRATPLGYFLRAMALIHLSAQLWFTFMDPPFSYSLSQYLSGLLVLGVVILLISPMLVATTFFIFDFPVRQKLALAAMLMGHIIVLVPLQAVIHGWIIYRATLLAMPMLYLLFGVLLDMFIYVALYGWGMSWRSNSMLDAGARRGPAPPAGRQATPLSSPVIPKGPSGGVPLVGLGNPRGGAR